MGSPAEPCGKAPQSDRVAAALLVPDYTVEIIDAIALRMTWPEYEKLLETKRPKYYITQVTAPTLTNDMYGAFLAKGLGATTMAFGTHVTPMPRETLEAFPALDYVLRGEPELTFRELIDTLETAVGRWEITAEGKLTDRDGKPADATGMMWHMFSDSDPLWAPAWTHIDRSAYDTIATLQPALASMKGLAYRENGRVKVNMDRPFVKNLDDLPIPLHHLLPLKSYRIPMVKGPYTFIVTSRGCTAGCTYCIKHVSYQYSVRLRSPKKIVEEIKVLKDLGITNIHMYADLFTVSRDQVQGISQGLIDADLKVKWTCNSRVDYVDEELLKLMARAGCWYISWGLESANEQILKHARKGTNPARAKQSLLWAKQAGIKNWGYFIIGLPGETRESIQETINYSKHLPLDIALFHVAAPYPGTPFFFEVLENDWFRPGTQWESVDMDQSTVLDYPGLKAEELLYWQKRAFREWAFRPGPMFTYLKMLFSDVSTIKSALSVGLPDFLAHQPGFYSGLMLSQYTADHLIVEQRILSAPASIQSIPAAADQEDFVSMGMNTAIKNGQILDNAFGVLGIEFMAAAQALDFREFTPGRGTGAARATIRKHVAHLEIDRPLYSDHNAMKALVKSAEILNAVEDAVGTLE